MIDSEKKASQKINRSTFAMSGGTFLSRIAGFVRDMAIGYLFQRTETDAFFVAFRFPNFFRRFFGEGALTVSFIPIFTEKLYGEGEKNIVQAKNLMNSIYTLLLMSVSSLTVLGIILMEPLIYWMFEGYAFSKVPGKMEITIVLSRILFTYLFLVTLYAYYMAVANALNKFFVPALAPAVFNISIILSIFLIPSSVFPYPSMALAWGVIIGGIFQVAMTAGLLIKMNFLPVLTLSFNSSDLMIMLKKFLPAVAGVGGFALAGMLNVFFAGWLEEGAHTYIYYADRLLELPRSLVAVSMGTALLPALSKLFAQQKKESLLNLAAHQRDLLLYIILPCALGLYFLAEPLLSVLFERGRFDEITVQKTAQVLSIYSFLLVVLSLNQVLSSVFFSIKNTWIPAASTGAGLLVHIAAAPFFISLSGLEGLVLSFVFSSSVQLVCLCAVYFHTIGSFYLKRSVLRLLKLLPLLIVFSFYLKYGFTFFLMIFQNLFSQGISEALSLFFILISALVIYIFFGVRIKLPQALELMGLFKKRKSLYKS